MAKPEKSFRIGSCSASVFLNEAEGGKTFRTVSIERRYKDGDEWKSSSSLALSEIPQATAVLQLAMSYIADQEMD